MKTHHRFLCLALPALWCASSGLAADRSGDRSPAAGSYVTIPDTIVAGTDLKADVERGLFFVPENRAKAKSRIIAVAFIRFAAQQGSGAGRPPVFLLAGGPGSDFDFKDPHEMRDALRLSRTRDLIYISQRGNPIAPGLVAQMNVRMRAGPLDKPTTPASLREAQRAAFTEAIKTWAARGVDPSGYDILNIVDDVHELRAALGYDKVVLRGCSFGSQWNFSYLKRWPQTVDRAWLSGVEPLDYAYDSPKWLWSSLTRLAQRAEADPVMAKEIPRGGIMRALQEVVEKLDKQPVTVVIEDPATGKPVSVTIGASDIQELIKYGGVVDDSRDGELGNWPRFIIEMQRGDLRNVAARVWEARTHQEDDVEPLIGNLIDNSLGITAKRDAQLLAEPEARWLGDINDSYHNTRDITTTPIVGDEFRADWPIEVPTLLVNGDLDWSTPVENARHTSEFLKHGRFIEVEGGTHCGEIFDMADHRPQQLEQLYAFIDADFSKSTPEQFFATLPQRIVYPPIHFVPPTGPSLYEQWLASSRKRLSGK